MIRFLHDDLWDRLKLLCRDAKRCYVAVAYLGRGAAQDLPLGAGDLLVVDMSDQSVKTGRTDPREILAYLERDVEVYSVENLHAKVFILGRYVIVGSSNVSAHSRDVLVEAAVETTEPHLRAEALAWLKSIAIAPVTPEQAKRKAKLYQPPAWTAPKASRRTTPRTSNRAKPLFGRLWIVNTHMSECTEEEERLLKGQANSAKRLLSDQDSYEVETIRYSSGSRFAQKAQFNDLAIQIHKQGRTSSVYPPARVLRVRTYRLGDSERIAVHVERSTSDKGRTLAAFKDAAHDEGIKITRYTERMVPDSAHQRLLQFFTQGRKHS